MTAEPVVIRVEREMVQVEKPQPVLFCHCSMATDCVVLIRDPNDEDDVKCGGRVLEKFGHYGLHTCKSRTLKKLVKVNTEA